jgi:hypothetical protein
MTLGHAALHYAEHHGWHVLPLEPRGKRPLWGLGWEEASTDLLVVASWWEHQPEANVGVACTGDLAVLDIDGEPGERTLTRLEERWGRVPTTLEVHTGRGRHLYFQRPEGLVDGWRYGGLELKASGYVVAPPSVHPSGSRYLAAVL